MQVLVTDGDERAGLAACRGLAAAGHEVTVAASRRPSPGHWSRGCSHRLDVPVPLDEAAFAAAVAAALRQGGHDALLIGSDAALQALSAHRSGLPEGVLVGLPPHEVVQRCLDKKALRREAETVGFAQPETVECATPAAAFDAAHRIGLPLIVKPSQSVVADGSSPRRVPARLVQDRNELAGFFERTAGTALVQRFHDRATVLSIGGVCTPDGLAAVVAARWQRRWPPPAGSASFAETESVEPSVLDRVHTLLRLLGWQGIFELELLDLGGGRLAAIDLNPRPFGWMTLALRAGANLPAVWLEWLRDVVPHRAVARPGVRYRWEEGDLRHLVWQARRGHVGSALRVVRPRRHVAHAYFELTDPGPFAVAVIDAGRRAIPRRGSPGARER